LSDIGSEIDWEAHEAEAAGAIAAAATTDEIEDVRVRFLGRKSAVAQALRGVRDRESGMTLNAARERLESAFAAREAELERAAAALRAVLGGYED
jgi:phenylalanyl-tRNA synthetase alpha chain